MSRDLLLRQFSGSIADLRESVSSYRSNATSCDVKATFLLPPFLSLVLRSLKFAAICYEKHVFQREMFKRVVAGRMVIFYQFKVGVNVKLEQSEVWKTARRKYESISHAFAAMTAQQVLPNTHVTEFRSPSHRAFFSSFHVPI